MTPFFFGNADRRLYGAHDAASPGMGPPRAAVLCNPWGIEHIEAHRTIRQLAFDLARAGIHALRFDYYGTGDSGGEIREGEPDGWREDVLAAIEEACEIAGVERVVLIGLRMGASIAAAAAARRPELIESLVLWDPLDGGDYLAELRARGERRGGSARALARPAETGGGFELLGFVVDAALADRFATGDLALPAPLPDVATALVVSGEGAGVSEALGADARFAILYVPAPPCWAQETMMVQSHVPAAVLRRIVAHVA